MRRNTCYVCSAVLVWWCVAASAAVANNEAAIAEMDRTIRAVPQLSVERKDELAKVVSAELSVYPDLGQDKQRHAAEHLRIYLDEIVKGTERYSDGQFEVIKATLQWNLGNYARLPPISDNDRGKAQQRLNRVSESVTSFVNRTYTDTPPEVRKQLADRVLAGMGTLNDKVGNYFYPQLLYSSDVDVTTPYLVSQFGQYPFVSDNSSKFAPVASLLADPELAKASKDAQVEAFVFREAFRLKNAVQQAVQSCFDMKPVRGDVYVSPPTDLQNAHKRLAEELDAAAKKEIEKLPAKRKHEAILRDITEGTGITIVDGVVKMPSQLPADLEIMAVSVSGEQHGARGDADGEYLGPPQNRGATSSDETFVGQYNRWVVAVAVCAGVAAATMLVVTFRRRQARRQ